MIRWNYRPFCIFQKKIEFFGTIAKLPSNSNSRSEITNHNNHEHGSKVSVHPEKISSNYRETFRISNTEEQLTSTNATITLTTTAITITEKKTP